MKPERSGATLLPSAGLLAGDQADASTMNPFVGLRPFESEESLLFFGRREQAIELLQRLHATRFLAVVGSSGCGKSSLIRAGLIPKLKAGFLVEDRDLWHVATMKPGDAPLENLAAALLEAVSAEISKASINEYIEAIQGEGAQAVNARLQQSFTETDANLLLLVDQFEELFRFALRDDDAAKRNEAEEFVAVLLELAEQRALPIYVVLTMRSDFIGDCDNFFGLPEAMNRSQYLVPRLTRRQRQEAIEGPIRLFGASITQRLLDRVLNDAGDKSDQLPVMQHALMRTWEDWQHTRNGAIDVTHYESVGTIKEALSKDAECAMEGLSDDEIKITKQMFQALTDTDARGRRIRRPARLSELEAITTASRQQILTIITRFHSHRRNFVNFYEDKLTNDVTIDISHESLIRQWVRLGEWVSAEADARKTYLRIVDAATLYKEGRTKLWQNPELAYALDWRARTQPTPTWAARYNDSFEVAMAFLDKSRRRHRSKSITLYFLFPLLVFGSVGAYTLLKHFRLQAQFYILEKQVEEDKDDLKEKDEEQRDQLLQAKLQQEAAVAEQSQELLAATNDLYRGKEVVFPHPIVGDIRLRRLPDGRMIFFDHWLEQNIVAVDVPELREIAHPINDKLLFNRLAAARLQAAFRTLKARGLLNRVLTWDYGFVRPDDLIIKMFKLGVGGGPSTHALGIGFDLNRKFNKPGRLAAPAGRRGSVVELVPIFRDFGFIWAGNGDATHFQFNIPQVILKRDEAKR